MTQQSRIPGPLGPATGTRRGTLDIDSSENPVHGPQEQSAVHVRVLSPPLRLQPGRRLPGRHAGGRFSCPSLTATRLGRRPSSSERTRPLRYPFSTMHRNGRTWPMLSDCSPIRCWSGGSGTC
jgi:hypothetical protein